MLGSDKLAAFTEFPRCSHWEEKKKKKAVGAPKHPL